MDYQLRPVCESDYEWLYELRRAAYRDVVRRQFGQWDEDQQRLRYQANWKPERVKIVLLEGAAVGMIAVEDQDDCVRLQEIQVCDAMQGRGLGTRLILDLLSAARERGMPLRLRVLHQNHRAKALYERLGFKMMEVTEHHFELEA